MNAKEFLTGKLIEEYGQDEASKIIKGLTSSRKTTFRTNTSKIDSSKVMEFLEQENISYHQPSWYKDAFILEENMEEFLKEQDLFKEGQIYMQSLSSMIPPFIVDPKENESILDMTASPGGKTTLLANLSNQKALITAVEKNKIRAERLKYNIEHQGAKRVSILVSDARRLPDYFKFDKVLLDAPCSGSGTIKLDDPNLDKYFSKELVENSTKIQKQLLEKAIKLTKVGGEIIYSTCSILKEENEKTLEEILKHYPVEIIKIENEIKENLPLLETTIDGVLCIAPNEYYEGFFVAKLKKIKD